MRTREDIQDIWEKIVDKGFAEYDSLKREERIWFNIEQLTTGGILDLYVNYGAENIDDKIEDLKFLGFDDIAELVNEVNSFFSNGKPPKDIDDRKEQLGNWTEQQENRMEDIENLFWDRSDDLDQALIEYLNKVNI